MKLSKVVLLSVFITAVILVVIGGVTATAFANSRASKNTSSAPANPDATVQAYQEREAQYDQLIWQANQQLDKANTQIQALQDQVNRLNQAPTSQPAAAASVSVSQAAEIARQAAGPDQLAQKDPDLVQFQGKAAYEVSFEKGIIYVDAQTGEVLYNGTVPQQITAEQAGQIVSDYLHNTKILSIDQVTIGNAPRYRVVFRNGTLAWVDLTGQITDIQLPSYGSSQVQASAPSAPSPSGGSYHDDDHFETD